MASSGKKKTTMAKLTRESKLRERRLDKKQRKEARKQAAADGTVFGALAGDAMLDDDMTADRALDDSAVS